MVDSNKISSLTRTWPTQPINKDRHDSNQSKQKSNKDDKPKEKDEEPKDPGDTIIDEYV